MCTRYALTSSPETVRACFGHLNEMAYPPRYNIAPTQPVAIVRLDHARRREIALVRWGLIPSWVRDPARLSTLINARAESAAEKPSFRGSLRHRRCLVPADAWYDWSGPAGERVPCMLRPAAGGPIAFAGLWEHWLGANGSEIETMAILTVASNADVKGIGERMPVIVPPEHYEAWLDTTSGRSDGITPLLRAAPVGAITVHEVSSKVNNPRNEGPETQETIRQILI